MKLLFKWQAFRLDLSYCWGWIFIIRKSRAKWFSGRTNRRGFWLTFQASIGLIPMRHIFIETYKIVYCFCSITGIFNFKIKFKCLGSKLFSVIRVKNRVILNEKDLRRKSFGKFQDFCRIWATEIFFIFSSIFSDLILCKNLNNSVTIMYCELSAIKILSFLNFILCLKLNSQVEAGLLGRISNLET